MELFEKDEALVLNERINNHATLLWRFDISPFWCECSFDYTSISSDGSIIAAIMSVAEGRDKIYFFNRQGKRLWKSNNSNFSMTSDGTYIALVDYDFWSFCSKIKFFDREGNLLWSYKIKFVSSILISSKRLSIIAEGNGIVYFFDRDGELLWSYKVVGWVHPISISSNGSYIAAGSYDRKTNNGKVYFFNRDGILLWSYNIIGRIQSTSISSDGSYLTVAVGSKAIFDFSFNPLRKLSQLLMRKTSNEDKPEYNEVYFFDREGNLLWNYKVNYQIYSVSVSFDGSFVTVKGLDKVYFFNQEGKELWNHKIDDPSHGISVSSDCSYIAIKDKDMVYFFNQNGKVLWNYKTGNPIRHIYIPSDGSYIALDSSDKIYLFNREGSLLWSYKIDCLKGISVSSDGLHIAAWRSDKVYFFENGNHQLKDL